ncbi:Imm50 family immunity protein [Streptomyces sp. MB22_4]|uniref:Imm50 family immunity protein n=1 Tax=Streptomyces sp. MB22_4 TaxID=3383120 RepID=UPI0039A163C7
MAPLYGSELPALSSVRLRSVNLNWRGPEVALRLDLPAPPFRLPDDWTASGANTVQAHLRFLAVADLVLSAWEPPVTARISMAPLPGDEHRIQVTASAAGGTFLEFTASADVLARHVSGFRLGPDGSDDGPHLFLSKVDARRHSTIPDPCEKTFYER